MKTQHIIILVIALLILAVIGLLLMQGGSENVTLGEETAQEEKQKGKIGIITSFKI